jgi:DNA-binding protein HU-beta
LRCRKHESVQNRVFYGISGRFFARNPYFWAFLHGAAVPNRLIRLYVRYSLHPPPEEKTMAKAATAATKTAKPATATTVTLKHLAATLAEAHEMSKKQSEAILGDLVALVTKHLKKGERIRIGGLGILQVRKRAARMGRNPATGEQIQIKASKKVAFRAAKELKEAV